MKLSKEQTEFLVVAGQEAQLNTTEPVTRLAHKLLRLARQHRRLAEQDCNVGLNVLEQQRERGVEAQLKSTALMLFGQNMKAIEFGGDPRGFTVKLHFKSGRYNSWGGKESGYGIPS